MSPHIIEFITVGFGLILLMFEAFSNGNKSRIGLIAAGGLAVILSMLFCTSSILSVSAIAYDRYQAIINCLEYTTQSKLGYIVKVS